MVSSLIESQRTLKVKCTSKSSEINLEILEMYTFPPPPTFVLVLIP